MLLNLCGDFFVVRFRDRLDTVLPLFDVASNLVVVFEKKMKVIAIGSEVCVGAMTTSGTTMTTTSSSESSTLREGGGDIGANQQRNQKY
jgi:hypothetical protein